MVSLTISTSLSLAPPACCGMLQAEVAAYSAKYLPYFDRTAHHEEPQSEPTFTHLTFQASTPVQGEMRCSNVS
jgi:hypothetical protein